MGWDDLHGDDYDGIEVFDDSSKPHEHTFNVDGVSEEEKEMVTLVSETVNKGLRDKEAIEEGSEDRWQKFRS